MKCDWIKDVPGNVVELYTYYPMHRKWEKFKKFFFSQEKKIPNSTEYCRKMSGIFPIFHCNWNIFETFLSNIAKYFIATL